MSNNDYLPDETKIKYWEQLRNAIVHEDNLVNQRLTWLLTTEGFLLTGFFIAQAAILSNKLTNTAIIILEFLLAIIFMGAYWVCLITGLTIAVAYRQLHFIKRTWYWVNKREERFKRENFEQSTVTELCPKSSCEPLDAEGGRFRLSKLWARFRLFRQGPEAEPKSMQQSGEKQQFDAPNWRLELFRFGEGDKAPHTELKILLEGINPNEGPEFPPIAGDFKFPHWLRTELIPRILSIINLLAAFVSVVIIAIQLLWPHVWERRVEQQKVKVALERDSSGRMVKATLEMDGLSEGHQSEIKKLFNDEVKTLLSTQPVLRSQPTPISTPIHESQPSPQTQPAPGSSIVPQRKRREVVSDVV